jgi:hypothetical protein
MTNQEAFNIILNKVELEGFDLIKWHNRVFCGILVLQSDYNEVNESIFNNLNSDGRLLFLDHEFAKCFFREEFKGQYNEGRMLKSYEYNLQQMVLDTEPFQYLKDILHG